MENQAGMWASGIVWSGGSLYHQSSAPFLSSSSSAFLCQFCLSAWQQHGPRAPHSITQNKREQTLAPARSSEIHFAWTSWDSMPITGHTNWFRGYHDYYRQSLVGLNWNPDFLAGFQKMVIRALLSVTPFLCMIDSWCSVNGDRVSKAQSCLSSFFLKLLC